MNGNMAVKKREREHPGKVIALAGPMFARKTEELMVDINRAELANEGIMVFKPTSDTRCGENVIRTHDGREYPATPIDSQRAWDIMQHIKLTTRRVYIDEAGHFGRELVDVVQKLKDLKLRVYLSTIDKDYLRQPFGIAPQLFAIADEVRKITAVCRGVDGNGCEHGNDATESFRLINVKGTVLIGGKESYRPMCNPCYLEATTKKESEKASVASVAVVPEEGRSGGEKVTVP
jgi:thymidine kinase